MTQSKLAAALAFTAALGSAALGGGAVSAADLGLRPYTKAPLFAEPVYNWAGFYVGGNVGGAWTTEQWINTANTTAFGDLRPGQGFRQHGAAGVFGGGQMGYNWQAANYVFGLEGTIAGFDNHGTLFNTAFAGGRDDQFSWRANWMATITGRAGYAVNNHLFYVKGGYAGVNNRLSVLDATPPVTGSGSQTQWHNGWTVGAGWEYGMTPNWIVGLEYDYAAFENKSYQLSGPAAGVYTFDAKPRDIQSAVVRLSYKFGVPLVARY